MVAVPVRPRDHKAWLAYWAEQLGQAIAEAVAHPEPAGEDFRLNYAVHCARIACGRAFKVQPRLQEAGAANMPRTQRRSKSTQKLAPVKILKPETFSGQPAPEALSSEPTAMMPHDSREQQTMTLTLKGLDKRGRMAIYTGAAINLRLGVGAFPNKTAPATIEVADGAFAPRAEKVARKRLTKEERAALPKPTLAERIAAQEKRLAAAKAKLAAEQGASASL